MDRAGAPGARNAARLRLDAAAAVGTVAAVEARMHEVDVVVPDPTWRDSEGRPHRIEGPYSRTADGHEHWVRHGLTDRSGGPAMTLPDGTELWYAAGVPHRDGDGPAAVQPDGLMIWIRHGCRHRDDGPALVDGRGGASWYRDGRRHRADGPAVISHDGELAWHLDGVEVPDPDSVLAQLWQSTPGLVGPVLAAWEPGADLQGLRDAVTAAVTPAAARA